MIPEFRSSVQTGDKGWKLEFIPNHMLMPHRTLHFEPFTSNFGRQTLFCSWVNKLKRPFREQECLSTRGSRGTLMQRFCCVFQTESAKCTNLIYLVSLLYFRTLDESLMLCIHTSICGVGEVNGRVWGWMNKGKGEWVKEPTGHPEDLEEEATPALLLFFPNALWKTER